jgi:HKD family nuclease
LSVILQPIETNFLTILNRCLAEPYSSLKIAVAWAREDAIKRLLPSLKRFVEKGGHIEVVVGLNDRGTSYEALRYLLRVADVYVFFKHSAQTFHPKIFIFEDPQRSRAMVIVGSNNLTVGGLWSNFELSLKMDLDLTKDDQRRTCDEVNGAFLSIKGQRHVVQISDDIRLKELLDADLAPRENQIRRRRPRTRPQLRQRVVPTGIAAQLLSNASPPMPLSQTIRKRRKRVLRVVPLTDVPTFYVRTFTPNEIGKIYRTIPGTLEFGVPLKARTEFSEFWKWRDSPPYQSRRTKSGRVEWEWYTEALLDYDGKEELSSVRLWDYARRHEFRIQVDLRPSRVTRDDLLVFERADSQSYDFIIRHIRKGSAQFDAYSAYAVKHAAQHKYGYGP